MMPETPFVDALPLVSAAQLDAIRQASRDAETHRDLLAAVPAMQALEVGGEASAAQLPQRITVAAWNLERCLFPQQSAAHLAPHAPSVLLLSEMDHGMARTAQANTAAEMAAALGMGYAYGVEFLEMDLGGPTERAYCRDDFNARGFHGNAILSTVPFQKLALMRLDQDGHWFLTGPGSAGDADQPRLGGRMAVAAVLPAEERPICVVSTHLESNCDAEHRSRQFAKLLDWIDDFAPDMPVLIGGDLNTGNHLPPDYDWRGEGLFDLARDRGYHWDLTAEGVSTRASLITPHQSRNMKLDWFCARGCHGTGSLLPALGPDQVPLSDHEAMLCQLQLG